MNTSTFFEQFYRQSQTNCILIMDISGIIVEVNDVFNKSFGYNSEDLKGKSFKILFTKSDKEKKMPEKELKKVISTGQSNDDNYVVDKYGIFKRCSGESILVTSEKSEQLIVKVIVNLQAKKYLKLF